MKKTISALALLVVFSAVRADDKPPPRMPEPVKPEFPADDAETKLVKFIKQKDAEIAKAEKTEAEAKAAFDKISKSVDAVALNTINPTPEQEKSRVVYMDAHKYYREAQAATNKLRTDRYTAIKELKTKVGIVRVRELGIKD